MSVRDSWAKEMESVFLYRILAEIEPAPGRRALFEKLALEATAQAGIWAERIQKTEGKPPDGYAPALRARIVAALLRRLGPERMRGVLAAMKVRGMSVYATSPRTEHPVPHSVEEIGRRHRTGVAGGNLRAAVFGASDGLVSNFCLILGVTGAAADGHHVLVAGVAGLLAGAFSMAAGEWISVRSQREMFEHQIGAERDELAEYPAQEAAELSLIYQARGLGKDDADRMAGQIVAHPAYALDTLAREELGVDPSALGSPLGAALTSFVSFAVGAAVPLAPFVMRAGASGLAGALALTAAALFAVGCTISLFTGKGALAGGLRMLAIGAAAGGVTYGIGRALGAAVG